MTESSNPDADSSQHGVAQSATNPIDQKLSGQILAASQRAIQAASDTLMPLSAPVVDTKAVTLAAARSLAAAAEGLAAASKALVLSVGDPDCADPPTTRQALQLTSSSDVDDSPPSLRASTPQNRPLDRPQTRLALEPDAYQDDAADLATPHSRYNASQPHFGRSSALGKLPQEIKEMIYSEADIESFKQLRLVCREWHEIATPICFRQVYLHRCQKGQSDFNVFMRLCLRPVARHIRSVRLCDGHCDTAASQPLPPPMWLDLEDPSDDGPLRLPLPLSIGYARRSHRDEPVARHFRRQQLRVDHLDDDEDVQPHFLSFWRSIEALQIKSTWRPNLPAPHYPLFKNPFLEGPVGLKSLTISGCHLVDLFGKGGRHEGLLGHVLYPRLHTLVLEETTSRMHILMQLLLPHSSTLRRLILNRFYLDSQDWRSFLLELGGRRQGTFNFEFVSLRVGKTALFEREDYWKDLVTKGLGPGRIEQSETKPPKRPYINGFDWFKQ